MSIMPRDAARRDPPRTDTLRTDTPRTDTLRTDTPRIDAVGPDDGALRAGVAALVAAAVARREAVGLGRPTSPAEYGRYLDELLADALRGDAGLMSASDDAAGVAGTAQWRRSPYPTRRVLAELDRVVVAPEARGAGVGRRLVEAVLADASGHGVEVVTLTVRGNNHGAIAMYESCGFVRRGLIPNGVADGDARHDIVLMCRELGRPDGVRLLGSAAEGAGSSVLERNHGQDRAARNSADSQ
jgi:ribosomal protein S18 acetylase RimI-like enzyme